MTERYHPGEDVDVVDMADVRAEADHADAVLEGAFDVERPDPDTVEPNGIEDEDAATCRWCRE